MPTAGTCSGGQLPQRSIPVVQSSLATSPTLLSPHDARVAMLTGGARGTLLAGAGALLPGRSFAAPAAGPYPSAPT
jgi:hypothetical protein